MNFATDFFFHMSLRGPNRLHAINMGIRADRRIFAAHKEGVRCHLSEKAED
jgi:hypothetical protein